jgi:hypothetical protein
MNIDPTLKSLAFGSRSKGRKKRTTSDDLCFLAGTHCLILTLFLDTPLFLVYTSDKFLFLEGGQTWVPIGDRAERHMSSHGVGIHSFCSYGLA